MHFVLGPWRDLRHTYLLSSLALALPLPIGLLVEAFQPGRTPDVVTIYVLWAALHMLLFPLAQEFYFGLTEPVRRGLGGLILWGPLLIALFVFKITVYIVLTVTAVPFGALAYVYLAFRAHYRW